MAIQQKRSTSVALWLGELLGFVFNKQTRLLEAELLVKMREQVVLTKYPYVGFTYKGNCYTDYCSTEKPLPIHEELIPSVSDILKRTEYLQDYDYVLVKALILSCLSQDKDISVTLRYLPDIMFNLVDMPKHIPNNTDLVDKEKKAALLEIHKEAIEIVIKYRTLDLIT